jgi:hypothetical protein
MLSRKWTLYWAGLVTILFGLLYLKNTKMTVLKDKPWYWPPIKTLVEGLLLITAAAFSPIIIVAYSTYYLTKWIKRPGFKIGAAFVVGTALSSILGWALEVIVLTGIFSVNLLSDDFIGFYEARRMERVSLPDLTNQ